MLVRDRHTVLIRYSLKKTDSSAPALKCTLEAAPLLAFRGYHDLTHANMDLQVKTYPAFLHAVLRLLRLPALPRLDL